MSQAKSILSDLIALPSVNPMGRSADANSFESRVTDYLEQRLRSLGVPFRRCATEPGRDNLVAWLEGRAESSDVVVWEAHQDTVPVEGMSIDPFCAEERDGRLYGRGACDVKGGLAAMLAAFENLAETPPPMTLVLAFSVNEEFGGSGASCLAEMWRENAESPFDRDPAAVVVAEPTELNVVAAHKGVVRWRCRTNGVAAHSSTPDLGRNAIYEMARVISSLEHYANKVAPALASHPRLGQPTMSVGLVEGGVSVNVVPESCWIEIDRRLVPGEDPLEAWRHAVDFLNQRHDIVSDEPYIGTAPLADQGNQALVERIRHSANLHQVDSRVEVAAYGSDASHFAQWPTVVFGPGNIAQAHTHDEWIELKQLDQAVDILTSFARDWT